MSATLLVAVSPGEIWAALAEGEALRELRLLRRFAPGRVGDFFRGRIVALRPELPAVLVDIGLDRPAFLSGEDGARGTGSAGPGGSGLDGLQEGQALTVQMTKAARADKAAGVSLRLRLAGRLLTLTPARPGIVAESLDAVARARLVAAMETIILPGEGFVLHPAATTADPAALATEAAELRARWRRIEAAAHQASPPARLEPPVPPIVELLAEFAAESPEAILIDDRATLGEARAWLGRHHPDLVSRLAFHAGPAPLFEAAGIAAAVETALAPRLSLPGGGTLTIETVAAATMIDVDSGSAPALATNLAAAGAIARQIYLRDLAGPIVVDFVGMKKRGDRDAVLAALAEALGEGERKADLLGWTRLGHVELVRKRRHAPLAEMLFEHRPGGGLVKTALTLALDALRLAAREAEAMPGAALTLTLHPEVAAALDQGVGREARHGLEARLGRPLTLVAAAGQPRERIDIRAA